MNEPARYCPGCGTELALALLSCAACQRLVYSDELKRLAAQADAAALTDPSTALACWRRAIELLPPGSRQQQAVSAWIGELSARVQSRASAASPRAEDHSQQAMGGRWGWLAGIGAAALLVWKFKAVLILLLSKAKLLLMGLTKASTVFTMLASFSLYWSQWGWKFAAGLVVSIYIHEMGHVAMLRRFGIRTSAPMFIPGLGAVVLLKQHLANPREDARVGLAGPIWGLGAAVTAFAIHVWTGAPIWGAVGHVGAWVNLFNLFSVWQLDGGRGFNAMSRWQRVVATGTLGAAWAVTHEGLLALLFIGAVARVVGPDPPPKPDHTTLVHYVLLVAILSWMCMFRMDPAAL